MSDSVEALLKRWHDFDLDKRKRHLDDAAAQISDTKASAVQSRKTLTDMTKEVRKLPEPDRMQRTPALLKAYQGLTALAVARLTLVFFCRASQPKLTS